MRNSRYWRWGGFLVVVAGGFVVLIVSWMSPGRVSYPNYGRIHAGMTKPAVERVLGGPAGDYRRAPRRYGAFGPQLIRFEDLMFHISVPLHGEAVSERRTWQHWLGDGLMIEVEFNDEDIVTSTSTSTLSGPGPILRFDALFTDAKAWLGF